MTADLTKDAWAHLRRFTPARLALGRAGSALPTREVLNLALAHARARDAVHIPLDPAALEIACRAIGFQTVRVRSAAADRSSYLRRPDFGRRLNREDAANLRPAAANYDLAIIIADGLSSSGVQRHAVPLLAVLKPLLDGVDLVLAPVAIAEQGRVALGDEIGALLGARASLVLIGERPGLSSPDSLGAYLTFAPEIGRTDAERNCVSNIRNEGLDYETAARRLFWLVEEALRRGKSGVALKDESGLQPVIGARAER
ncbi:MAG TPA: ethanolamine ammonia-lyase subunit EutC [Rhizomicrobium sp.]|jgi:ethanolamine ammonia-lyase small subunit